jgi:hypothetical protein
MMPIPPVLVPEPVTLVLEVAITLLPLIVRWVVLYRKRQEQQHRFQLQRTMEGVTTMAEQAQELQTLDQEQEARKNEDPQQPPKQLQEKKRQNSASSSGTGSTSLLRRLRNRRVGSKSPRAVHNSPPPTKDRSPVKPPRPLPVPREDKSWIRPETINNWMKWTWWIMLLNLLGLVPSVTSISTLVSAVLAVCTEWAMDFKSSWLDQQVKEFDSHPPPQ